MAGSGASNGLASEANLGCATTRQLLEELQSRMYVSSMINDPNYDGHGANLGMACEEALENMQPGLLDVDAHLLILLIDRHYCSYCDGMLDIKTSDGTWELKPDVGYRHAAINDCIRSLADRLPKDGQ